MTTALPPTWAEAILRLVLRRADRESVSGDLLEEYRDTIVPSRGQPAANLWYVRQVMGFIWRATWFWALLFSGSFVFRTAYDWLVPTTDFHVRAEWSTYVGVATFFVTGLWAAWRSGSFVAGPMVAAMTSLVAALFSVVGASLLVAILDSPQTRDAIAGSGGLDEVYFLPFMMIVPAVIIGGVAGALGSVGRKLFSTMS